LDRLCGRRDDSRFNYFICHRRRPVGGLPLFNGLIGWSRMLKAGLSRFEPDPKAALEHSRRSGNQE
jgi:hypothetical protein